MINLLKEKYTAHKKRGFTLIELIVVMAIIAVLVLLAAPRFMRQTENAQVRNIQNDVKVAEMKVSEALVDGTDVWKSWSDDEVPSETLKGFIHEDGTTTLYGKGGPIKDKDDVDNGSYRVLPRTFIEQEIRSRLDGTFYANDNGTVYYERGVAHKGDAEEENGQEQGVDSSIMGVTFNVETGDATRIGASVGKNATIGIGPEVVVNDFDHMPIYKDMKRVTVDGNEFVRIPKFYINKTSIGDEYSVRISGEKHDDTYYLPAVFKDFNTGKELDYFLYGVYEGSLDENNKLRSVKGEDPLVSTTIAQFREYARANGDGYQQNDIHAIDVLQALFRVEFATLNSQTIHPGLSSGSKTKTGTTDDVVASSGALDVNGTSAFNYRGIENPWGNVLEWIDGVNFRSHEGYVATDARDYASDKFDGVYKSIGYKNPTTDGDVAKMGYNSDYPFAEFPTSIKRGSVTSYDDYYWQDRGDRTALFGGMWSSRSSAGLTNWNLTGTASGSYAAVGGRLLKKPL